MARIVLMALFIAGAAVPALAETAGSAPLPPGAASGSSSDPGTIAIVLTGGAMLGLARRRRNGLPQVTA